MAELMTNVSLFGSLTRRTIYARAVGMMLDSDRAMSNGLVALTAQEQTHHIHYFKGTDLSSYDVRVHHINETWQKFGIKHVVTVCPYIEAGAVFHLPIHFRSIRFASQHYAKPFLIPRMQMRCRAIVELGQHSFKSSSPVKRVLLKLFPLNKDNELHEYFDDSSQGRILAIGAGCLGTTPLTLKIAALQFKLNDLPWLFGEIKQDFFSSKFNGGRSYHTKAWYSLSKLYANENLTTEEKHIVENAVTYATLGVNRAILKNYDQIKSKYGAKYPNILLIN